MFWTTKRRRAVNQKQQELERKNQERLYEKRKAYERQESAKYSELRSKLNFVMPSLRSADPRDYQSFLNVTTHDCTHDYDYNMGDDFYVAISDFVLPSLCGAISIHVIVPSGITVTHAGDDTTHCNIYSIDNPEEQHSWLPSYNDAMKWGAVREHLI